MSGRSPVSRIMVDFQQMKAFAEAPFIVERAEGVHLYDESGKEYLDGLAGVFVASVGHCNSAVIESIVDQMHTLTFAPPLAAANQPAIRLAERLSSLLPPQFNLTKFTSGGSEAVEMAIKMARQHHKQTGNPEKYKIIATYGSYHGGTMGALSLSGVAARRTSFEPMMGGVVHVHPPNFARCPLMLNKTQCEISCVLQFEEAIRREGPETVAAVIVEPVMNVEGLIVPPPSYFKALREICDRYNVLLIYDEVISGFGRTGTLFFAEQAGAWPDMLCVGKGMSGGYTPLAACIVSDKVSETFWGEVGQQFNAGHTFAGNPLSCAAGLAVLDYFESRNLLAHVAEVGPYMGEKLRALQSEYPVIHQVRGLGLWWGVEFNAEPGFGKQVEHAARERGLIIRGAPTMISFGPPLTVMHEEVDEMVARLAQAIDDVVAKH